MKEIMSNIALMTKSTFALRRYESIICDKHDILSMG